MINPLVPVSDIKWFVGRIHVSASNLDVCRELWRRMRGPATLRDGGATGQDWRDWSMREIRHDCYRVAIAAHAADRELYAYVMGPASGRGEGA